MYTGKCWSVIFTSFVYVKVDDDDDERSGVKSKNVLLTKMAILKLCGIDIVRRVRKQRVVEVR